MPIGNPESMANAARYVAAGTEFAGSVVAGVIAGYYLDSYLGTAPGFTLLFTLTGMAGGVYRLIWALNRYDKRKNDD